MLHQTFLFLGQLWQLFELSQILEFLRYIWSRLHERDDRHDHILYKPYKKLRQNHWADCADT